MRRFVFCVFCLFNLVWRGYCGVLLLVCLDGVWECCVVFIERKAVEGGVAVFFVAEEFGVGVGILKDFEGFAVLLGFGDAFEFDGFVIVFFDDFFDFV